MARAAKPPKANYPPERYVLLQDYRSRWDGVVQKICAGPRAERSVSPGEIAVFTPTGAEVEVTIEEETRSGTRPKAHTALVYRRSGTRLVSVPKPSAYSSRTDPPFSIAPERVTSRAVPTPSVSVQEMEAPVLPLAEAVAAADTNQATVPEPHVRGCGCRSCSMPGVAGPRVA